jgi:hypothetical protein
MSISLIVTRSLDEDFTETGKEIALEEWLEIIESDPDLRIQAKPYAATNPKTGETILVPVQPGQAELANNGEWIPFLGHSEGELSMRLAPSMELETDPARRKVAELARRLGARITYDAADEILKW